MTLELIDDGTLDTVFRCDVCYTQERVTVNAYLDSDWLSGDEPFKDDRVRWSRELVEQDHVCENVDGGTGLNDLDWADSCYGADPS